jgi:hypothetical protein
MPVVDGHSGLTKDFYLKDKEGTTSLYAMEQYRAEAEGETGKKMKAVRVDGGGEFANDAWRDWAKSHGIRLEIIPAYSSAANGVAERKHGATFARVRAILHDSGLPKSLWTYAVAYITYTDNLLPSARANFQIPAEIWTGKYFPPPSLWCKGLGDDCKRFTRCPRCDVSGGSNGRISGTWDIPPLHDIGSYHKESRCYLGGREGKSISVPSRRGAAG